MTVESLPATDARALFADLARLRITVFRDFPYLYDGDPGYEERYLATYAESPGAVIVIAREGERVVGAATGLPLRDETDNVIRPFRDAGLPVDDIFYFGESVLLPDHRGRGIGVAFFDHREAWARRLGFPMTVFCGVQRPDDHPLRPKDHVPLDAFWRRRGYRPVPSLVCEMSWRDIDQPGETAKPLAFWSKTLAESGLRSHGFTPTTLGP